MGFKGTKRLFSETVNGIEMPRSKRVKGSRMDEIHEVVIEYPTARYQSMTAVIENVEDEEDEDEQGGTPPQPQGEIPESHLSVMEEWKTAAAIEKEAEEAKKEALEEALFVEALKKLTRIYDRQQVIQRVERVNPPQPLLREAYDAECENSRHYLKAQAIFDLDSYGDGFRNPFGDDEGSEGGWGGRCREALDDMSPTCAAFDPGLTMMPSEDEDEYAEDDEVCFADFSGFHHSSLLEDQVLAIDQKEDTRNFFANGHRASTADFEVETSDRNEGSWSDQTAYSPAGPSSPCIREINQLLLELEAQIDAQIFQNAVSDSLSAIDIESFISGEGYALDEEEEDDIEQSSCGSGGGSPFNLDPQGPDARCYCHSCQAHFSRDVEEEVQHDDNDWCHSWKCDDARSMRTALNGEEKEEEEAYIRISRMEYVRQPESAETEDRDDGEKGMCLMDIVCWFGKYQLFR